MLAQGQSASEKRGGLATDVSSGLILLKKKKKILNKVEVRKRKRQEGTSANSELKMADPQISRVEFSKLGSLGFWHELSVQVPGTEI